MKVLLHIGQSKTGTSAIQAFLSLNRVPLKEAGILYPAVKIGNMELDIAHNAVADALMGKQRFPYLETEDYFTQFFEEARNIDAKLIILSAEHFFQGEPRIWDVANQEEYFDKYKEKVERLSSYLSGHDVSIVIYLRPQIDWFSSAISQTIRIEGLIGDKKLYQNDRQFFELMKPLLMYSRLLDVWADILNPSSFIIVPYIKNSLYKNSSISDFLYRIKLNDINLPYASEDVQVNKSLTREYIEVKKKLNKNRNGKNRERVIIRCLEKLSESSTEGSHYILSDEVKEELCSFVKLENSRLKSRYKIDNSFFKIRMGDNASYSVNDKTVDEAMIKFNIEYGRLRYRVLWLNYTARSILRKYAKPIHAFLHQMKMSYLHWKYKS